MNPVQTQDESSAPKLNKKKKKKGKVASDEASDNQPHSNSSADPLVNEVCDQSSEFVYSDKDDHNNIDLCKLKLPPGITITKVNTLSAQGNLPSFWD